MKGRRAAGRARRANCPRRCHAVWQSAPGRDPLALVAASEAGRQPDLLALRQARLTHSPFAFYRGTAAVMAADLATTAVSGLEVQLCGDAHVANFGYFATPERDLVFDIDDFDETLRGPFEWDVKRLGASVALLALQGGATPRRAADAAETCARGYRRAMRAYAELDVVARWYAGLEARAVVQALGQASPAATALETAERRDRLSALAHLTAHTSTGRRFVEHPPLLAHAPAQALRSSIAALFARYLRSLPVERRVLLERFQIVDLARKVVGVGSVGWRCYVVLLEARDDTGSLVLQLKEARPSVLEPYLDAFAGSAAARVVAGQRSMQHASDICLGVSTSVAGASFYWRQLWDEKGSVDATALAPGPLARYGAVCARALARAHARTGDAPAIAGYLGSGSAFDVALGTFAVAYARQTIADHVAFCRAA